MKLSLVTSSYKKEGVILLQLDRIRTLLDNKSLDYEIIVVIDGLIDNTKQKLEKYISDNNLSNISILVNKVNKGKGYSIRKGLHYASGDIIGYIDADTDIQIKTLDIALDTILNNDIDCVAPSKFHKDSNIKVSLKRRFMSKGFQLISRTLLPTPKGVDDVSCGLKLFKKEAIKEILPLLSVNRFAIDSEVFFQLNRAGYKVEMVPFFMEVGHFNSTADNVKQILLILKDITLLALRNRVFSFNKQTRAGFELVYRYFKV